MSLNQFLILYRKLGFIKTCITKKIFGGKWFDKNGFKKIVSSNSETETSFGLFLRIDLMVLLNNNSFILCRNDLN